MTNEIKGAAALSEDDLLDVSGGRKLREVGTIQNVGNSVATVKMSCPKCNTKRDCIPFSADRYQCTVCNNSFTTILC